MNTVRDGIISETRGMKGIFMRKRFSLVAVVGLVVLSLVTGAMLNYVFSSDNIYEQITKFKDVLSIAEKYYVEDIDTGKLTEAAIAGMLEQLDPHSNYIPSAQLKRVHEEFQGSFEGVGIEYQVVNDTLLVVAPIVGGPSEALGIQAGDKIIRINDTSAIGITQAGVQKKLRGPKGTKVQVAISRAGIGDVLEFEITRDKIPLYTVGSAFMVDGQTGYVQVTRFAATTHDELIESLAKLKTAGMKRMILDLRNNAGGYLEQAFKMVDEFLPAGHKVVYTKGRRAEFDDEYLSSGTGKLLGAPLIILVDNSSASASEIVAGAVQDWDRGLVVGETTFGKGLVQREFNLKDGSALRLTTARYYTPSGRLIQREYGDDRLTYTREAFDREEREGDNINHEAEKDSTRQEFRTLSLGRTVYGGGGITPDHIVKSDKLTEYTVLLRSRNVILEFADKYVDQRPDDLRGRYGAEAARFVDEFEVTPDMLKQVQALATSKGIEFKADLYEKDLPYIKAFVKAYIGKRIWGNEGFVRAMLSVDHQFNEAMMLFPEAEEISRSLSSLK
jgi:carboxyl-terminal processing protease